MAWDPWFCPTRPSLIRSVLDGPLRVRGISLTESKYLEPSLKPSRVLNRCLARRRDHVPSHKLVGRRTDYAPPMETPRKSAVLFGPEDSGLNRDDLSCCTALIRIPTTKVSSLNLAQAVMALAALLKHEATQKVASSDEPNTWAPMAVQNHLIDEAMELLEWSGYLNGRSESE